MYFKNIYAALPTLLLTILILHLRPRPDRRRGSA